MRTSTPWVSWLSAVIAFAACAPAEKEPTVEGQSYAGWFLEHEGQGTFQPCGLSQQWQVSGSAELRTRATEFKLTDDSPVYVRLLGAYSPSNNKLKVSRVEQFGSPTPVRNCGMTGVVIPTSTQADD